ncbi:MAG: SGNH/GDSL hydrolase family protein [Clostridiaceae bacterium]|nr:SGNH/GDSL hydrolase family protein [Clostridiaceae bacterium]
MTQLVLDNRYLSNWYIFGDSVCKGIVYNSVDNRYELSKQNFINILADKFKAKVKNFASFGATIKKGLTIFQRKKEEIVEPGIAFLGFGGNDCDYFWADVAQQPSFNHQPNVPLDSYFELYKELINNLQEKNIIPVIINLPPLDPDRYFNCFSKGLNKENLLTFLGGSTKRIYQWHESYNSVLTELAIETGALYIDVRQRFLEEINPERYMCEDGIHPNDEGHKLISEILYKKINEMLIDKL